MSLEINLHWSDESVEQTEDGSYEFEESYRVVSDQPISNSVVVLTDPRVPLWGSQWPVDSSFVVRTRRFQRDKNTRNAGTVFVTYQQNPGSGLPDPQQLGGGEQPGNPIDWAPKVSWNPVEGVRVAERGWRVNQTNGAETLENIQNSAGLPFFDPPAEMLTSSWQVLYQRNELFPSRDILEYVNVLNSDAFVIDNIAINPREALMMPARIAPIQFKNGVLFREVTYEIRLKPKFVRDSQIAGFDGWNLELQDRGYLVLDAEGNLVRATDDDGNPTPEPVFLDGTGKQAANPEASDPRIYRVYPEKPFAIWNFF